MKLDRFIDFCEQNAGKTLEEIKKGTSLRQQERPVKPIMASPIKPKAIIPDKTQKYKYVLVKWPEEMKTDEEKDAWGAIYSVLFEMYLKEGKNA